MTMKRLSQPQLMHLERVYEKRLKMVKAELKLRRAAHAPKIKTYKSIKT